MAYDEPQDVITGELATASVQNSQIIGSIKALRVGELALLGQAAGGAMNDMYATSASQWAVGARQLRQTFRGLVARTHPDADKAAYQCLASCEAAVMSDGTLVEGWANILFDVSRAFDPALPALGGLDTTEQASTWYQKYLIRKSSDGTKAGLLHRAKDYFLDESNTTIATQSNLRDGAGQTKRAQTFDTDETGPCEKVEWKIGRVGAVTGRVWVSIYATAAGLPTGAALKTSDKLDASLISTSFTHAIVFPFRDPATLTAGTTYAAVLEGDFAISGAAYLVFDRSTTDPYAAGQLCAYDGATWTGSAVDAWFKVYITRNDTAVTMPTGYDQRCHVGWVYNNSGSNFLPMSARDRAVYTYGPAVAGGAATVATLVDLASTVPPCPLMMTCASVRSDGAAGAGSVQVQPGLLGYGAGFGYFWHSTGVSHFLDRGMELPIEFQYLYYLTNGSACYFYPLTYRW